VKDVAAPKSFGLLDLLKAYDTGVIYARRQVLRRVHVRQALEFVYKRPGLDEELD